MRFIVRFFFFFNKTSCGFLDDPADASSPEQDSQSQKHHVTSKPYMGGQDGASSQAQPQMPQSWYPPPMMPPTQQQPQADMLKQQPPQGQLAPQGQQPEGTQPQPVSTAKTLLFYV